MLYKLGLHVCMAALYQPSHSPAPSIGSFTVRKLFHFFILHILGTFIWILGSVANLYRNQNKKEPAGSVGLHCRWMRAGIHAASSVLTCQSVNVGSLSAHIFLCLCCVAKLFMGRCYTHYYSPQIGNPQSMVTTKAQLGEPWVFTGLLTGI